MAVTDAYATAAMYRATDRGKIDTSRDSDVDADLLAVSRYIDAQLGRFFTKDASAVARVFEGGKSGWRLRVDDIAVNSGVIVKVDMNYDGSFSGETAWSATDFTLYPLNADKGPEPRPWT